MMFRYTSILLIIYWLVEVQSSSSTVAFLIPLPSSMEAGSSLRLVSSPSKGRCLKSSLVAQLPPKIDIAFLDPYQSDIQSWLDSLTSVQRATPYWFTKKSENSGVLAVSPSQIVQNQLDELLMLRAKSPTLLFVDGSSAYNNSLFSSSQQAAKFDEQWKCSLQSSFSADILESVLQVGGLEPSTSNTHLLRLQLVAVPPNCNFPLHAHAAIEMAVPLVGQLCERRTSICLDPAILQRKQQHRQDYQIPPTPEELKDLAESLSQGAIFFNHGVQGGFEEERVYPPGCPLVNEIGSIHQSFTPRDHGVLFLGMAASMHIHFLPGNFRQRHGIASLKNIDHLIQ